MILKASQRGGGKQLAVHLMRTDENEHVEIHEIRGFVSDDLPGALKEAYAVSQGTKCKQFLFSVSLNPPEQERVGIELFEQAAERIEQKTGLAGHPRIIVFHEKEGRRHAHAVWSRVDAETMTAKNLPHFKLKLRDISRDLYLENDWKMPRGLMNSAERDPRNFTLAEWQQAKRAGLDARDLKATMQECWAVSDSRAAFAQALKERGLTLARGDRRGHVALTHEGEALSVARYVGKKAKEVRLRLGEPDALPSVDEAKHQIASEMLPVMKQHLETLRTQHQRQREPVETRREAMAAANRAERQRLDEAQRQRWEQETRDRANRLNKGMRGLWDRLTGRHKELSRQNTAEALAALQRDRDQRQSLIEAQMRERQALQTQIRSLRDRQADELKMLLRDREHYRGLNKATPDEGRRHTSASAQREERRGDERSSPSSNSLRSNFDRLAQLRRDGEADPASETNRNRTPADRLEKLRDGRKPAEQSERKGPEPER